jgi:hypothetical protein
MSAVASAAAPGCVPRSVTRPAKNDAETSTTTAAAQASRPGESTNQCSQPRVPVVSSGSRRAHTVRSNPSGSTGPGAASTVARTLRRRS